MTQRGAASLSAELSASALKIPMTFCGLKHTTWEAEVRQDGDFIFSASDSCGYSREQPQSLKDACGRLKYWTCQDDHSSDNG